MRKTLTLLVALCMLLSVGASALTISGPNEFPIADEPVELNFFARITADIADYATNVWTLRMEELTGIHVNWETVPLESEREKVNLLLAASDLPDVFFSCTRAIRPTAEVIYGSNGTFVDLKPLIDEHGYYIKKMYEAVPYIEAGITTPTGAIYSLPQVNECFHCYYSQKMWINQTWLDALGLEAPTTTEEFKQVLIAFRDGDPNGNGIADEIPLVAAIPQNDWQAQIHGFLICPFCYTDLDDGISIAADGETVELSFTKDEFREGLKYLNDLYENGLIAEATFTQNGDDLKTMVESGDIPYIGCVPSGWFGGFSELAGSRQKDFTALEPLTGPEGVSLCGYFPYGYGTGQYVITSACKIPEVAIKWADYLYSEEASLGYIEAGREGIEWRYGEEGEFDVWGRQAKWRRIDTEFSYSQAQNVHYYQQGPSFRSFDWRESWYVPSTLEDYYGTGGYECRLHNETAKYVSHRPDKVFPPLYMSEDDSNEITRVKTSINNYRDEMITQFIIGNYDIDSDADWQMYLDGLEGFEASYYLDILQRNYDQSYLKDAAPSPMNPEFTLDQIVMPKE
ncbi:MAG: extracellular solute-binding protein [Christensenellales bacterium]|jgi:putative aldouronate transport system substrate-binding protein